MESAALFVRSFRLPCLRKGFIRTYGAQRRVEDNDSKGIHVAFLALQSCS